jgi:chromatin remodeling complex protein RSC6
MTQTKTPSKKTAPKKAPVKKKPVKEEPVKEEPVKEKPVKEEPVKETPVKEESVTEPESTPTDSELVTETEKVDPTVESINALIGKFEMFEKESKVAKNELRKVLKSYQKKTFKKTRKVDPNRQPTGFAKPSLISEELCKFLNKPSGTKMARTDVTKEVNKYIKEHNLQNPANKKEIKADTTLTKLLNLKKGDDLNYFSLQKFLKDHFPKEDTSVST